MNREGGPAGLSAGNFERDLRQPHDQRVAERSNCSGVGWRSLLGDRGAGHIAAPDVRVRPPSNTMLQESVADHTRRKACPKVNPAPWPRTWRVGSYMFYPPLRARAPLSVTAVACACSAKTSIGHTTPINLRMRLRTMRQKVYGWSRVRRHLRPALYSPPPLVAERFPTGSPAANRAREAVSAHSGDDRWRFRPPGGDAAAAAVVVRRMSTATTTAGFPELTTRLPPWVAATAANPR